MDTAIVFKKLKSTLLIISTVIIKILGVVAIIAIFLSFTDIPYNAYYSLGTKDGAMDSVPDCIVLLGGVGMPSPDGLIRSYYAAKTANEFPEAKIVIAFPDDSCYGKNSPELKMSNELIVRGVDSSRILFERNGYNTYTQAQNIAGLLGRNSMDSIAIRIVSSPEHMYRAVKTFRKTGFKEVGGMAAFECAVGEEKLIKGVRIKREKQGLNFRYNMWNYMKYEITVLREYCAIVYYKLKGWI